MDPKKKKRKEKKRKKLYMLWQLHWVGQEILCFNLNIIISQQTFALLYVGSYVFETQY
jgi:hypothetical protein